MNKKAEWRIKADSLIEQGYSKQQIVDYLFIQSGYTKRFQFAKKVQQYIKLRHTYSSAKKNIENFIGKEYKETRSNNGEVTIIDTVDRRLSDDEIFERYGRSKDDWRISMVWFKDKQQGYLLSCCFVPLQKTPDNSIKINEEFVKSISKIPVRKSSLLVKKLDNKLPKCCIVIPKQDAHHNKFDTGGKNDITNRYLNFRTKLLLQLEKVKKTNNISEVFYIVGSDEFNSEWNESTTKGTPQSNILTHQQSFERITGFNIETIEILCEYSLKVNVILLNGNHDHNTGWHLANVLKQVFRNNANVIVDDKLNNTKVLSWGRNLILMNHGDELKPKDLANKFPVIANSKWSSHENYYVITGDKHHERASDVNGIMTYQVPQLSTSRSAWDDKKVHITSKPEMVNFVFEVNGLSAILRNLM